MRICLRSRRINGKSFTHGQIPPDGFEYVGEGCPHDLVMEDDVTMGGPKMAPAILFLPEARWLTQARPDAESFLMTLTNDAQNLANYPRAHWIAPFGTWVRDPSGGPKTRMCSMIASNKAHPVPGGYAMRRHVVRAVDRARIRRHVDVYGTIVNLPIAEADKEQVLIPYRFSVAIESQSYPWYHTEKLFDCFAAKTVPLYWGCEDGSKLREWGFDTAGIVWWSDPDELVEKLTALDSDLYDSMLPAIETNYQRTWQLYCFEAALEEFLEKTGFFDRRHGL